MQEIRIRKMAPNDFAFAIKLTDTMNWDLTRKDFEFMMNLEPRGCCVALDETRRVGLITTMHFGRVGWIGNVIVTPSNRSKGVGALLVKHAIDYLVGESATTIGLYAYVDTVQFYEKLGFKANSNFIRLVGQGFKMDQYTERIVRMAERDLEDVARFDERCMGWNREPLLKRIFRDSKDLCYVARDSNKLLGFIMADSYRQEIGPCVSSPRKPEVAINLLRAVLGTFSGLEIRVGVSESRLGIVEALREMKFQEEFKVVRMYWGQVLKDKGCLLAMESLERG
ncbi:MAG TPA: GNAT family N-acetyltransferase [Candidatus Bathyarchaeia archaeon]|nr:GNAT family N-acetyltransferase [Candidatus Bathyarchaeia archaeon]